MLDREQTFKVTCTVHDSQYNNLIWVWLIEEEMLGKACDRYATSATQLGGTKVTR
jgi:hypothetical protein